MRVYISNVQIQETCCYLLCVIVGFDSLVDDVVAAAISAMQAHPTHVNMQTEACHILGIVSASDDWELCIAGVPFVRKVG